MAQNRRVSSARGLDTQVSSKEEAERDAIVPLPLLVGVQTRVR